MMRAIRSGSPEDPLSALLGRLIEKGVRRRVFQNTSAPKVSKSGKTTYELVWHKGRIFQLLLTPSKGLISIPNLLPALDRKSTLYRALVDFIAEFPAEARPEHRRVMADKASLAVSLRGGMAQLSVTSRDGDLEYAFEKMVQAVNEVFLLFVISGEYFEYRVKHLGAHPDWGV
jgi:hypothetical protein